MAGARERHREIVYFHETTDRGHGRSDKREISVVDAHNVKFKIPGIQQVAEIIRTRTNLRTKKTTQEKVLMITNIPFGDADASKLLSLNRSYWDIENKLHYRKDMVFAEDRSTIRAKHGPANMATLRNFAIGLLICNDISNIKRCVDNLRHNPYQLLQLAA